MLQCVWCSSLCTLCTEGVETLVVVQRARIIQLNASRIALEPSLAPSLMMIPLHCVIPNLRLVIIPLFVTRVVAEWEAVFSALRYNSLCVAIV